MQSSERARNRLRKAGFGPSHGFTYQLHDMLKQAASLLHYDEVNPATFLSFFSLLRSQALLISIASLLVSFPARLPPGVCFYVCDYAVILDLGATPSARRAV
jgi:hypothetical protein